MQLLNHSSENSGVAVVLSFLSRVGATVLIFMCVHARNARSMVCTHMSEFCKRRPKCPRVRPLWACSRPYGCIKNLFISNSNKIIKNKDLDGFFVDISLSRSMWNVLYCKLMSHVEAASVYIYIVLYIYIYTHLFVCLFVLSQWPYQYTYSHTHTTLK